MSYARFSEGDVYLYFHFRNGLTCQACHLMLPYGEDFEDRADALLRDADAALKHIQQHRDAGHRVPKRAFIRLRAELLEPPEVG